MELALLVWLVGMLTPLGFLFLMAAMILCISSAVFTLASHVEDDSTYLNFVFWKAGITFLVLGVLIPSPKTAQYMVGAYLLQSVYQSDIVNKAAPLAEKAILNQLQAWAKDNPEVATLIENVPEAKEQK